MKNVKVKVKVINLKIFREYPPVTKIFSSNKSSEIIFLNNQLIIR